MAKSSKSQRDVDYFNKNELLEDEARKAQKHRRKQFSEFLEEDEDYQRFNFSIENDVEIDDETLAKYLKR